MVNVNDIVKEGTRLVSSIVSVLEEIRDSVNDISTEHRTLSPKCSGYLSSANELVVGKLQLEIEQMFLDCRSDVERCQRQIELFHLRFDRHEDYRMALTNVMPPVSSNVFQQLKKTNVFLGFLNGSFTSLYSKVTIYPSHQVMLCDKYLQASLKAIPESVHGHIELCNAHLSLVRAFPPTTIPKGSNDSDVVDTVFDAVVHSEESDEVDDGVHRNY